MQLDLMSAIEATGPHPHVLDVASDLQQVVALIEEGTRQFRSRTGARNWGEVHKGEEECSERAEELISNVMHSFQGCHRTRSLLRQHGQSGTPL